MPPAAGATPHACVAPTPTSIPPISPDWLRHIDATHGSPADETAARVVPMQAEAWCHRECMSPAPDELPELIPGEIVCPPWCNELHNDRRTTNVEDGLVHVSPDIALDPFDRPPHTVFNLVAYESPSEPRRTLLEMTVTSHHDRVPLTHEVTTRGQADTVISELEQAAVALRRWRTFLPSSDARQAPQLLMSPLRCLHGRGTHKSRGDEYREGQVRALARCGPRTVNERSMWHLSPSTAHRRAAVRVCDGWAGVHPDASGDVRGRPRPGGMAVH